MTVGVDTDVLVNWAMSGAPHHRAVRRWLETEVRERHQRLGITPQVIGEFLHICTDPRRFQHPLSINDAVRLARTIWDGEEVTPIFPSLMVVHRTLDMLTRLRLGRKRILDTLLAATLEAADVRTLATLNAQDFEVFPFLEVVRIV